MAGTLENPEGWGLRNRWGSRVAVSGAGRAFSFWSKRCIGSDATVATCAWSTAPGCLRPIRFWGRGSLCVVPFASDALLRANQKIECGSLSAHLDGIDSVPLPVYVGYSPPAS